MFDIISDIKTFFTHNLWIFKTLSIVGFGFLILWFFSLFIKNKVGTYLQPHMRIILNKVVWYGGVLSIGFMVLSDLGIDIRALVGAAGIVGLAVGFAAKTSVSNIISGIFLIIEQPFNVGDVIETGSIDGTIESIDLLAVRIKTSDGIHVRVPNESLINAPVKNKTFYKERRITIPVMVDKNQDLANVVRVVSAAIENNEVVKKKDATRITVTSEDPKHMELTLYCWIDARNVIHDSSLVVQGIIKKLRDESLDVAVNIKPIYQSIL